MGVLAEAFDLTGQVAAVTGGANGIGKATAEVLAEAGAAVVVGDLDAKGANDVAAAIVASGGQAVGQAVDVRSRRSVEALVGTATSMYGGLDIMCNIAGIAHGGLLEDVPEAELDHVFSINMKGVLFGCQAAIPAMKARGGGAIVNVSSTGIDVPKANNGVYAMSKAAVAIMSSVLAHEVGAAGIRVNSIAPGATITKFTERHLYDDEGNRTQDRFDSFVELMKSMSPINRIGEAVDQALLILYLVSPAAKYANGNIFRVNGGQSMPW